MARYQIILAYDGTEFLGSQRQVKKHRTVQGELENALRRIGWDGTSVLLAGRTDAGVHASGQVAAFDFEWAHRLDALVNALNANLPADMAIQRAQVAPDIFHPRFDATARRYRYRIFSQPQRDPLRERYAWRVFPAPAEDVLHALAAMLPGIYDFAAFGSPPRPCGSTERHLMHAHWERQADEWHFEVQANAFLYHMVRRLVRSQIVIGQGKFSQEIFARALADQVELPSGIAPPNGLTLVEVTYPANLQKTEV